MTPPKLRRAKIQVQMKELDPALCQEITSESTEEASDDVIVFVGFGKATRSWDRTTSNKFTKYAPMFWKQIFGTLLY